MRVAAPIPTTTTTTTTTITAITAIRRVCLYIQGNLAG